MLFKLNYIPNHDVEKVHEILNHFFDKLQTATIWDKNLFPEWYAPVFDKNLVFQQKLKNIFDKVQSEAPIDLFAAQESLQYRAKLYQAFQSSNEIEKICNDTNLEVTDFKNIAKTDFIYKVLTKVTKKGEGDEEDETENVLRTMYSDLTSKILISSVLGLKSIKDHYVLYERENGTLCPFCGMETLPLLETEGRPDYDHFLSKDKYGFSSVNMRNLVPMGDKCNKRVKGSKNLIIGDNGNRCLVFFPYMESLPPMDFELDCIKGKWKVDVHVPDINEKEIVVKKVKTWDRVFNILARYAEYIKTRHEDLIRRLIEHSIEISGTISEAVINMLGKYINGCDPFKKGHYPNYIPERIFFEYCSKNKAYIEAYERAGHRSTTAPIIPPLMN